MSGWSEGYVSEINYTYGYYRELAPAHLAFAALVKGGASPTLREGSTYLELGCGQGLSANLLAAANPDIEFYATDFNPAQIAGALELSRAAATPNIHFLDDSFEQMLHRTDLPDFDYISLHGIYSWISAENRANIVELIRRKLKPGGFVYISYNALPGWAAAMPLRQLLVEAAAAHTGSIVQKIENAIKFVEELFNHNPRYLQSSPSLKERLNKIKGMPRQYLAHEYFNKDWTPFYVSDVVTELSPAKLSWFCSANLLDGIEEINLSAEQRAWVANTSDAVRREVIRDFVVNQQFRRDLFVKGQLPLEPPRMAERWDAQAFVLSMPARLVPLKISTPIGEVALQEAVYGPIVAALAEGPTSLRQLLFVDRTKGLGVGNLRQALTILVGAGHVQPCLPPAGLDRRREAVNRINAVLLSRSQWSQDIAFLASPVTGGGIAVDRIHQMFLLAVKEGSSDPVGRVWQTLRTYNQRLLKDGVVLEKDEENIEEIRRRHEVFVADHLHVYRVLQII